MEYNFSTDAIRWQISKSMTMALDEITDLSKNVIVPCAYFVHFRN